MNVTRFGYMAKGKSQYFVSTNGQNSLPKKGEKGQDLKKPSLVCRCAKLHSVWKPGEPKTNFNQG
jgi:hypothetical protein